MTPTATPPGLCMADVHTFLTAGREPRAATDKLLRAHGVDPSRPCDEIVPFDLCWRIFADNVVEVNDETHRVFEERTRPGATTLTIARMLLCETLVGAFEAYADACSVLAPGVIVSFRRQPRGVALRWQAADPDIELHQILIEGMVVVYYAAFAWMVGQVPRVLRVRAPARRRASPSTLLNVLNAPVQFAGEHLELLFATEAAETRLRDVDVSDWRDGLYREVVRLTLHADPNASRGAYSDEVRAALLDGVDQQAVAAQWGVSPKTVARRLEQEGCSFRGVRDEVRMQRSATLMRAGLTVEAIGEAVGYEDARSFRRAFRRWFGVSPSMYRLQWQG